MRPEKISVIVARMQVPELTSAHLHLLGIAAERGDKVAVVLGTTARPNKRNPLTYQMRRDMLRNVNAHITILPHADVPGDDHKWSNNLDHLLLLTFPDSDIELLGSRGSFLSHYKGGLKTHEVPHWNDKNSGTKSRYEIANSHPSNNPQFRCGVIWAVQNYFPQEEWSDTVV